MRLNTLVSIFCLAGLLAITSASAQAQNAPSSAQSALLSPVLKATNADAAWSELDAVVHTEPAAPDSWKVTPPTEDERVKYLLPFVHAIDSKIADFYTRFPKDTNAMAARLMELQFLMVPLDWGLTNEAGRLKTAGDALLANPATTSEQHLQLLWMLANKLGPADSRPYLQEIVKSDNAPDDLKTAAQGKLTELDTLGKPIDLQFTAVDGRKVNLADLKGKVVLLDFWATWCPPCVGEVPDVKHTYDDLHGKGFEVVGISLDEDKGKLTHFTTEHKMEWPQYFDGLHWQNKYARQFGVESIPAMWLLDKKGIVRTLNARADLEGEVQKLLAE